MANRRRFGRLGDRQPTLAGVGVQGAVFAGGGRVADGGQAGCTVKTATCLTARSTSLHGVCIKLKWTVHTPNTIVTWLAPSHVALSVSCPWPI